MLKVSRSEAVTAAVDAMDKNEIVVANNILKIVSDSISLDKKNNTFSPYIELKKKKDISLFKNNSQLQKLIIKEQES